VTSSFAVVTVRRRFTVADFSFFHSFAVFFSTSFRRRRRRATSRSTSSPFAVAVFFLFVEIVRRLFAHGGRFTVVVARR